MTEQAEMNWGVVKAFWPQIKTVAKCTALIVVLDIMFSLGASLVFDDAFYFKKYTEFRLYEGTKSYRDITHQYFSGQYKLAKNAKTGWVNSSNYQQEGMLWSTDFLGARTAPTKTKVNYPANQLQDDNLMFLVGSSVLSGYRLPYDKSPVAQLQTNGYSAFSFGTIMYSIDQTYTFYKEVLAQYQPKILVVGIHNDPEVISNMFVPFRLHDMSVPFLKPAYFYQGDQVVKKQPPMRFQEEKKYNKMLAVLKDSDAYYHKFAQYRYFSMAPIANIIRKKWMFVDQFLVDDEAFKQAFALQQHFMRKIVDLAKEGGTEVVFVKFAAHEDQERPWHMYFYSAHRNNLHNSLLKQTPFNIIYTSEIFANTGRPLADFYQGFDTVHFSADACAVLAQAIHQKVQVVTQQHDVASINVH